MSHIFVTRKCIKELTLCISSNFTHEEINANGEKHNRPSSTHSDGNYKNNFCCVFIVSYGSIINAR